MVAGDVEGLGDADEGVEAGGDFAGFVAADALAVGADLLAEVGLGPAMSGWKRRRSTPKFPSAICNRSTLLVTPLRRTNSAGTTTHKPFSTLH